LASPVDNEKLQQALAFFDRVSSLGVSRCIVYRQRCEAAAKAIADLEASKTLARAREAVELAVANRNCEGHVSPEIAQDSEDMLKARKETERGWQRAMDKIAERASQTKGPDPRR
jgi:hypothetical protein